MLDRLNFVQERLLLLDIWKSPIRSSLAAESDRAESSPLTINYSAKLLILRSVQLGSAEIVKVIRAAGPSVPIMVPLCLSRDFK